MNNAMTITIERRLISRLHIACVAMDELLTGILGEQAEKVDEICLLRSAILEAEKYDVSALEVAEKIISLKEIS